MAKDLTAFLTPNLELAWKGRVFVVPPPSKEDGIVLAALNSVGVGGYIASQSGNGNPEIPEKYQAAIEAASERDLAEISLGTAYQEMLDANVSGPDIDMFALYAHYYWTMGEEVADAILESSIKGGGKAAPKDRQPPKSSQNSGSGSRSRTPKKAPQSTPTTGSQKT